MIYIFFYSNLQEITSTNFNDIFDKFTEVVKVAINTHAPLKKLSCKECRFTHKPWFAKEIINFIG